MVKFTLEASSRQPVGFGPFVGCLALYWVAQHFLLWTAWYVRG